MIPIASSIPEPIVLENVQRLTDLMREQNVSAIILFDASNMLAFTGTPHAAWDRLTCGAVTREGQVHVICPAFERPGVSGADNIATIHTWREEENPYKVFGDALRESGVKSGTVGVDGRIWLESWYAFHEVCPSLEFKSAEPLLREVRMCKSPAVQGILRKASARGERLFAELRERVRAGVSEIELHGELRTHFEGEEFTVDPMIQSGPNGAIPHNLTGTRVLHEGDNIVVDSVTTTDGFNNDLTRTYAVGEPSAKAKQAYRVVREAHDAAIAAAKAGVECRALDRIAREIITKAGFGEFFTHRLGHGMGIECHEHPYLNGNNADKLRSGACVTVEPGVYVPGEFGVRLEDDILITESGCEVISRNLPIDVTDAFDR